MSEKGKVVTPAAPGLINKEDIPQVLPILPLRNSVFFPGGVLPLAVGRQKTIALIKDAVRDDQVIGVVTHANSISGGTSHRDTSSGWFSAALRGASSPNTTCR